MLHAWSRQGGHKEAHLIAGALLQALDDAPLTLTDHTLVNLRFAVADVRREADGRTYHAAGALPRGDRAGTNHKRTRPMTAQKGKDLLVKISDGAGGFTTVAGLRTRRLAFNAETVDITHAELRQPLARAARRRRRQARLDLRPRAVQGCRDRRLDAADLLRRHACSTIRSSSRTSAPCRARSSSPIWNSPASTTARSPTTWRWNWPAN